MNTWYQAFYDLLGKALDIKIETMLFRDVDQTIAVDITRYGQILWRRTYVYVLLMEPMAEEFIKHEVLAQAAKIKEDLISRIDWSDYWER